MLGALADGLGLPASQVRPAYEDALSRLAAAVRLPEGEPVSATDDLEADAADARAALINRLEETVTEPAAYVLPLHRADDDSGWASADWRLRRGRIVLLDGDSPAGLRLPLKSISWEPPEPTHAADPSVRRGALPVEPDHDDAEVVDADAMPTTAIVAEVRREKTEPGFSISTCRRPTRLSISSTWSAGWRPRRPRPTARSSSRATGLHRIRESRR